MSIIKLKAPEYWGRTAQQCANNIALDLNCGNTRAVVNNDVVIVDTEMRWCDLEVLYNAESLWITDDDVEFFNNNVETDK